VESGKVRGPAVVEVVRPENVENEEKGTIMAMTTDQVLMLAQFMDAVMTIAVENGVSIPAGQPLVVAVSDGQGSETLATVVSREKRETADCDYDWWLELKAIHS
jgi:hypothetical protein